MNSVKIYQKEELSVSKGATTRRKMTDGNGSSIIGQNKKSLKKWQIILLVFIIAIIIGIVVTLIVIFKSNKKNIMVEENNDNTVLSREKALEAYKSKFKIASKTNHLNQVLMKSTLKHTSISNGVESTSLSIFTMAKMDIFTLNESLVEKDYEDFYSNKYYTVITINRMCTVFYSNKTDCELQQYLDLTIKSNNLRRNDEEEDLEIIKEAILPICIIEHTDTNIIISVTCPETLSSNLKDDIILSFKSIKPETFQGIVNDKSIASTNITEKDNRKYIDSNNKVCDDYNGDPSINETCEEIKNIVTDLDGNLISMKKNSTKEIIKDEEHKINKIKTYYVEDISNSENFDSINYKKNLDTVFELIKPYMKKEDYFPSHLFNEILNTLMKEDSNTTTVLRYLKEEEENNQGVFEEKMFSKDIYGFNIELSEINDVGLDYLSPSKIITDIKAGNETTELSNNQHNLKLNTTLNKFTTLTNAAKVKASSLQEELNEQFLSMRNNIDSSINALNNLLSFNDLVSIFDSTLSISELSTISYTIVPSSENLYSNFKTINNDIPYSIVVYKNNLKEALTSFLLESHQLLYYIFSNLTETNRLLSSKKSKIAEISSYYLNNTDTSYVDIIQKAKEVLSNYYINEKKLIKPLIDKMLNEFYNDSIISAEKVQTALDILVEKLDSGTLKINLGETKDVTKVIDNIYNSKMKVKEILSNIVDKFNNSVGYQNNGFFETQKELDKNNKSYSEICNDSLQISYILDNNLLIDTTYDKIMGYFRDQFVVLLNYMEKSKREKFPLKENVLENSTFTKENIDKIDDDFKDDRNHILKLIKNENNEYLQFVKESLNNYTIENQHNLEKYISDIQVQLSDLSLDNLNSKYNETLTFTINQINKIINDNNDLAVEYLKSVIKVGSTHCTKGFKNKYNIYKKNLYDIMNFVKLNLKSNLVNKYKNIIDQIRSFLQKIKSNSIIEKYKNHLSFSEAHLRIIDGLFTRFDKYISDSLFNKNYLPKINNYIQNTANNLKKLGKNLNNLYLQISKLSPDNSDNDYMKKETKCWKCCKFHFIWCWTYGTCCENYYAGYNIKKTNNHLYLTTIKFSQYTTNLDIYYSSIYKKLSKNTNNYYNSINQLSTLFDSKKKKSLSENVDYLSSFSNNVESILNNYLGFNLLNESYNYYKNELEQKIPNELDDFLSKWNEVYDKIDEDLNSNLSKFKSNIGEFGLFGGFYYQTYRSNISYDYVDSIVQERKNDLNYTLKFYYNMISFKINKTYSYIMNNIPINDKPFDELLNIRISQIKNIYNNIMTKVQTSRNQILSGKTQLKFLKISEENFFLINNYINDNVDKIDKEIPKRYKKLFDTSDKLDIDDTEENVITKFYFELSQNGKQIKAINEPINKATFTDLKVDVYKNLLEEIFEIQKDELVKKIQNSLKESNENLIQRYKYEKDKYSTIIQNKIYKEYYTKEDLEKKINELYNNGTKELNKQSKNKIYGYLDQVLDNIKENVINEAARLNNEMTSYSNNYKVIEATLDEYKETIYNEFYSTIVSVVKDFYNEIKDKFYTNHIKKYLEELTKETKKQNFKQFSFLNITFDLKETVEETVELLINEYQNLTMSQIEYLYNKNMQNLDLLLSFSSIKDKINKEISNIYNSILLPALKVYAKYNPGDTGVLDYDFSVDILNNIDSNLNTSIEKTKKIMNKTKGDKYIIEEDWNIPSFSLVKRYEFKNIEDHFNNFTSANNNQEIQQIKDVIFENVKNNFNLFINNFIPSFGIDHFNRILKYNEIQKLKSLYGNLKYSLTLTLIYYIGLCNIHSLTLLPDNLKYKILLLNDLELNVKSNNDKILSSINSTFDEFIKDTKNYIVEKYISEIKIDPFIKESFNYNNNIIIYIEQILDGKRYIFEEEYIEKMNNYIKNSFIQEYSKTLSKETNEMLDFIQENRDIVKPELNAIFTLKPDDVLSEIENKLNTTLKAIKVYNLHLNSFNIPDNVKKFLEQYIQKEISPKYEEINNILNTATKDLIMNNLESNSEKFKNSFNYEEFESKNKEINSNLTNSFNKINESLKSYGAIESVYSEKLEKEISNSERIRNLDELDDDKIAYNSRIADITLDETFQEITNSSVNIKQFIESLNLFKEFDEKINKYINDINYQYGISQNNIKKNKDNYDELKDKLYELKGYSLQYYKSVNASYHETKEAIIESIHKMNELIGNCSNITFQTMAKKYSEIIELFNSTDEKNEMIDEEENANEHDEYLDSKNYKIKYNIKKYEIDNRIKLDIIFEDGDYKKPKIMGSFINRNRPKDWEIDISSKNGQRGKYGKKITSTFNNISLSVDFNFDISANKGSFNIKTDFDEYIIKNYYYEQKDVIENKNVGNIQFSFNGKSQNEVIKPDGENEEEIISAKKNEFSIPFKVE